MPNLAPGDPFLSRWVTFVPRLFALDPEPNANLSLALFIRFRAGQTQFRTLFQAQFHPVPVT